MIEGLRNPLQLQESFSSNDIGDILIIGFFVGNKKGRLEFRDGTSSIDICIVPAESVSKKIPSLVIENKIQFPKKISSKFSTSIGCIF